MHSLPKYSWVFKLQHELSQFQKDLHCFSPSIKVYGFRSTTININVDISSTIMMIIMIRIVNKHFDYNDHNCNLNNKLVVIVDTYS